MVIPLTRIHCCCLSHMRVNKHAFFPSLLCNSKNKSTNSIVRCYNYFKYTFIRTLQGPTYNEELGFMYPCNVFTYSRIFI